MNHVALFVLCAASFQAPAAILITSHPTPSESVDRVGSGISGSDMAGMIVRATYRFGARPGCGDFPYPTFCPTTFTAIWAASGVDSGMAAYSGDFPSPDPIWWVTVTGNTSEDFAWAYRSVLLSPLMSLELDGSAAGIYFDRASPDPGTAGSDSGRDADIRWIPSHAVPVGDVVVTYAGAVGIGSGVAAGDLYSRVVFDFSGLEQGGVGAQTFDFTLDADGRIPEPAAWLLVGLGLVAGVTRMRLNRATHRKDRILAVPR